MASCAVWLCTSPGHWVKAKAVYRAASAGHWSKAKAVSYKRTASIYQTCSTAIPTISSIAAITLTKFGTFSFRATITRAASIQWYYKFPGAAWVNWGASHRAGIGNGTASALKYNGFQVKIIAKNSWGTKTSNIATLHINLVLPTITRHPQTKSVARGGILIFHATAINYTQIKWLTAGADGIWREVTSSIAFGYGRTQLTLRNMQVNGLRVKAIFYNAAGKSVHTSVAIVHLR